MTCPRLEGKWIRIQVDRQVTSFGGIDCVPISASVFGLTSYVSEWLQTDHEGKGFAPLKKVHWSSHALRQLLRRCHLFSYFYTIQLLDVPARVNHEDQI